MKYPQRRAITHPPYYKNTKVWDKREKEHLIAVLRWYYQKWLDVV